MKNPLIDVNEDVSIRPFRHFSFFEKIGLFSALVILLVILVISAFSFYVDLFIKFRFLYVLIDLSVIIMCLGAMFFISNAFRRKIITDLLIDSAFQDGIYTRLQPLIEKIAQSHIDANIILDRISNMDLKIQNIQKERYTRDTESADLMKEPITVGTSIKFAIKTIFLIILTMAIFMFLVNFNLGSITPYSVLLIFIIWWGFITNEYNLWKESSSWTMVFFPILIIPVMVMLLNNLLNYNVMMAILYLSVGSYAFVYYLWAIYATTGSLPFMPSRKQEAEEDSFFAQQQKGIIKELLDATSSRLEQQLQKDEDKREEDYAWKK